MKNKFTVLAALLALFFVSCTKEIKTPMQFLKEMPQEMLPQIISTYPDLLTENASVENISISTDTLNDCLVITDASSTMAIVFHTFKIFKDSTENVYLVMAEQKAAAKDNSDSKTIYSYKIQVAGYVDNDFSMVTDSVLPQSFVQMDNPDGIVQMKVQNERLLLENGREKFALLWKGNKFILSKTIPEDFNKVLKITENTPKIPADFKSYFEMFRRAVLKSDTTAIQQLSYNSVVSCMDYRMTGGEIDCERLNDAKSIFGSFTSYAVIYNIEQDQVEIKEGVSHFDTDRLPVQNYSKLVSIFVPDVGAQWELVFAKIDGKYLYVAKVLKVFGE